MCPIHNSQDAYELLKFEFSSLSEAFWIIALNSELKTAGPLRLSHGHLNFCRVSLSKLFHHALTADAVALIVAHNHPGGNARPTACDLHQTKKILRVSQLIGIPMLDHIIFTDVNYFSFRDHRLI